MVTVVKPSQPTEAVVVKRKETAAKEFFGSQSESYEEARDDGNDIVSEMSAEVVHTGESAEPDDNTDENVVPASIQQNSLRSPKILSKTMSKLKPFSPRSLTSPMRRAKSNHFFNEPSHKSMSSPKKMAMKVLSPRAAPSPKKAPVEKKKVVEKVSLAVAPGRLGLSLKTDKQRGGALIMSIHPRCAFHGRIDVGDRIVYIDDRRVRHMDDFKVDCDKKRNFIIRRSKEVSESTAELASSVPNGQESKEDVATEPDGPPDDLSQQFSLVEMNSSVTEGTYPEEEEEDPQTQTVPALLSPAQSCASNRSETSHRTTLTKEEHVLHQFEANKAPPSKFNCAQGFISDRFSCAGTVRSDDTKSIKTLLKPIASLMECGKAHVADYAVGIYSADNVEPTQEMSDEAPTIAQISQLQISDHAFIKRSNGDWTYSTVLDIEKDSITFSVDDFGNGKTITKHRWLSSIRLVKSAEDEEDAEEDAESTVAEEYSMSISSSGSDDYSEDASPLASPVASPSAADMKAELKAKLQKKKMDLKAKKKDMKRQAQQAKAAAAEAKRKERELKEAQELELKLRLMDLEEMKLKQEEEVERKRMADLEEFKKQKLAKIEADYEEKRRKKLAKKKAELELEKGVEKERLRIIEEKKAKKKADLGEKKKKEQAKVEMKKLQKANQQAAVLEAQRQAELVFQNLEATMMATEISKKYQSN